MLESNFAQLYLTDLYCIDAVEDRKPSWKSHGRMENMLPSTRRKEHLRRFECQLWGGSTSATWIEGGGRDRVVRVKWSQVIRVSWGCPKEPMLDTL